MYQYFSKKVNSSNSIAIFMHINPDADCVGSSLALYKYLINLGKKAHVFLEPGNTLRKNLEYFPNSSIINAQKPLRKYDLGICLDCASVDRMGRKAGNIFLNSCEQKIWIDHHEYDIFPPKEDAIIETNAGATAQILYKIFESHNKTIIDNEIAFCLYGAIAADTGGFTFSSTSTETLMIASKILEYPINGSQIISKVYRQRTMEEFKLMSSVLYNAKFYLNNKVGIITFRQSDFERTNTTIISTEGIINSLIETDSVVLAIAIAEEPNGKGYKISLRSKGEFNASKFASIFGGGGHRHASGCKINKTYEKVVDSLLEVAADFLEYI